MPLTFCTSMLYASVIIQNEKGPQLTNCRQFGDSQVIPKAKLPVVVKSVIRYATQCSYFLTKGLFPSSSLVSPDSETTANNLVLVGHGLSHDIQRLEEMKISM